MLLQTSSTLLDRVAFIKTTDFFQQIKDETFLEDITGETEEQTFEIEETVLHKGDRNQLIFLVMDGKFKIHVGEIKMAELSSRAYFGDIHLFDSQPAPATVTALQKSRCLVIHQSKLLAALEKHVEIRTELIAHLYQGQNKTHVSPWHPPTLQDWYTAGSSASWAY